MGVSNFDALSVGGAPVLPFTTGNVFYVAASGGSDGNSGTEPSRAFATLDYAVGRCTANNGDVIIMLPGAHSYTASVAVDVAGITITGLPSGNRRKRATVNGAVADQTMNVTVADVQISHLAFIGNATQTGSAYVDFSVGAHGLWVHDCVFDFTAATASTSILGLDAIGAAAQVTVEKCAFISDGAFGAGLDMTATVDGLVRDCDFTAQAGTWAAALTTGAATDRLQITGCHFLDFNGTISAGVDGTGASIADGVAIDHCVFGENVSVGIDNYDAGECQISENYDYGIGSTDGGILIVAIT